MNWSSSSTAPAGSGSSDNANAASTANTATASEKRLFLRRNSLGGRSLDDLESQLGGFPLELFDLYLPVLSLVERRSLIDIFHPVAQHAVDQAGQLRGHGFDRDRSPQPGSQSTELRSQIGLALPQGGGRHLQSDTDRIIGWQPPFANDLAAADAVVRTQPQPGNKVVFVCPFAHIPSCFADDCHRGHDIDA